MLFSQRKGIKPVKTSMQIDAMDDDLRNRLWNVFSLFYLDKVKDEWGLKTYHPDIHTLCLRLWNNYFKMVLDSFNSSPWSKIRSFLKDYFFKAEWYEVYDFIEFVSNNYDNPFDENKKFQDMTNTLLEQEVSAYRFVSGKIAEITSQQEIDEIESAIDKSPSEPVRIHLKKSLEYLTDKKSRDYRNSIKEAISGVEALCGAISNKPKATLADVLKELEKEKKIHGALKNAFSSLYGYTSDAQGIRHALMEAPDLAFEDAKFMLIVCSAFINYLVVKNAK